jgi:streptogramin lyase
MPGTQRGGAAVHRIAAVLLLGLAARFQADAQPAPALATLRPGNIVAGRDGNLWFPETGTNRVARLTTSAVLAEFPIPDALALGNAIASGPDGKLWVTGFGPDGRAYVWTLDATGTSMRTAVLGDRPPVLGFLPAGLTTGRDGNVWIADLTSILRVPPAGALERFPVPDAGFPSAITAGPDGNLWFVESTGLFVDRQQALCRIDINGAITRVLSESKTGISTPSSIITGPDGNLWFADNGYGEIAQVTIHSPRQTDFPFGASRLAAGPDGNIWITVPGRGSIARLTTGGAVTEFKLAGSRSVPSGIAAGPDGNLWFTEPDNGAVGRVTPDGSILEFSLVRAAPIPIQLPRSSRIVKSR